MIDTHYLSGKLENLVNLLWLLDQSIYSRDMKKTSCIMATIKTTIPISNLSEDQKLRLDSIFLNH